MSEIVAYRYRYKDALTWVHSTTEPARHPNLIVEPLCVAPADRVATTKMVAWTSQYQLDEATESGLGYMYAGDWKPEKADIPLFSTRGQDRLIGNLLDRWEMTPNDLKAEMREHGCGKQLDALTAASGGRS